MPSWTLTLLSKLLSNHKLCTHDLRVLQVSIVAEQLVRLLHACGMPLSDVDMLHGSGATMGAVLNAAQPRSTLFTGSQRVAEKLATDMHGKVCTARTTLCSRGGSISTSGDIV